MMDARTRMKVPDTDPMMIAINRIWDEDTTFAQRRAYIEVTLKNSRDPHNMRLATEVVEMIKTVLR
jgi:hypothetical protein